MNHIRSALAAGLLAFGAAAVASAQQGTPAQVPQAQAQGVGGQHAKGEWGGRRRGGALLKGISLSAAEKVNLKGVHQKYAPQMKALRAQPKSDARREQMKQLMTAERNDTRAALVPENRTKFDANVTHMEQRMAQRKSKGARVPGGNSGL
jgi:Spy/CpxP family protein refolding chaperone